MTTSKISVFEEGLQTFPLRQSTASKLRKNFQGRKLSSSSFFDLWKFKKITWYHLVPISRYPNKSRYWMPWNRAIFPDIREKWSSADDPDLIWLQLMTASCSLDKNFTPVLCNSLSWRLISFAAHWGGNYLHCWPSNFSAKCLNLHFVKIEINRKMCAQNNESALRMDSVFLILLEYIKPDQ